MSITFYSMDAPQIEEEVECLCTQYEEGPFDDCRHCEGTGRETYRRPPMQVNMSNANARDVLPLLGISGDDMYHGSWKTSEEKADAMRRVIQVLNGTLEDGAIEPRRERGERRVVREGDNTRITTGATIIHGGRSEGYIRSRLEEIQTLLQAAIENDWTVTWS